MSCSLLLSVGLTKASVVKNNGLNLNDLSVYQTTVSGKITDDVGNPLAGVNVVEKGTTNGASSDFDGNYEITV
ncbi:MAG: hypothetical protein HKP24_01250, partial [Croceitalea sp.]|nr:hypothetical protein [Croceitalea sp.]